MTVDLGLQLRLPNQQTREIAHMSKPRLVLAAAFSCALLAQAQTARAEVVDDSSSSSAVFRSGLGTFGVGYLAAVVVAATSSHPGDSRLYVPVLGPWLDLGSRGDCPVSSPGCDHETINKVLIVGDGVIQAAGVVTMLAGLLHPTRTVVATKAFSIAQIVPVSYGNGSPGLAAYGRF
jgi:hypothetical protein